MKINTKIRYGLRTMLEIALSDQSLGILQKDIAKNQQISEKYLDQIVAALKAADLIANKGGKKSGYVLKKQKSEIRIYDIYKAFEPELAIIHCVNRPVTCFVTRLCVANEYWSGLNQVIMDYMQGTTLETVESRHIEILASMSIAEPPVPDGCDEN